MICQCSLDIEFNSNQINFWSLSHRFINKQKNSPETTLPNNYFSSGASEIMAINNNFCDSNNIFWIFLNCLKVEVFKSCIYTD